MQAITETFVHLCRNGNARSQKQLFELLFAPMYRVCYRYLNHKEDAEDCLMKGFMKAFKNLPRFEYSGDASLQAWVRQIMVNECLMALRRKSDLLFYPETEIRESPLPADVLQEMDAEALYKMVRELPAGYRTVFNLFAVEGYSHKEIAELLKITESTSKSQFSKARMKLKQMLEENKPVVYGKLGE